MTQKPPYLRIVIPTKNEEEHLPVLLSSIRNQTFKDLEVIVADANSIDSTREIARRYGCKVVDGGWPDEGRNNGVNGCSSPLVCFIDSDIILQNPEFIERAIREFYERRLDVAGTLQIPIPLGNQLRDEIYKFFYNVSNYALIHSQNKKPLMQNVMFAKTEVHRKIGGFPAYEFGEDSAFAENAFRDGYKFGILISPGKVLISPRRFEKKGVLKTAFESTYLNFMRRLGKEFKRGETNYWK